MSPIALSDINGSNTTSGEQPELNFLVIGAGSRGHAYGQAVTLACPKGRIAAIAEPYDFKRQEYGQMYIWGRDGQPKDGQQFTGWQEFVQWETTRRAKRDDASTNGNGHVNGNGTVESSTVNIITGVFICTLDQTHAEIIHALAPLNLHIMCEKPLALSLSDCIDISRSLQPQGPSVPPTKIISIGHVLRYSPHNQLLRGLVLNDRAIGGIVSIEHTEPVGWWHFSHSYVRGNWRRETPEGVGSLLTKSCHDIDFLMWLMCSPADPSSSNTTAHIPSYISSTGHLTQFRPKRKPTAAGSSTNCLTCPLGEANSTSPTGETCNYSALKIYRNRWLREEKSTDWPLKIVVPEIEDIVKSNGWEKAEEKLMQTLAEDYDVKTLSDEKIAERSWYGRCVYDADNNVCDDQTVTIRWDDSPSDPSAEAKTAIFHMTSPTLAQCDRRGRVYGTHGEIWYDSKSISVYTFATEKTVTHVLPPVSKEEHKSHGGGDFGLARAFVNAIAATANEGMGTREAQMKYIGADLEEIVRSHAVVFAAEEARNENTIVDFRKWWDQKRMEFA